MSSEQLHILSNQWKNHWIDRLLIITRHNNLLWTVYSFRTTTLGWVWESKGLTEPPHHSNAGIVWSISEQCQLVTQRMRTISKHYLSQCSISFLIIIVYFVSSRFSFGMLGYPTELKIKIIVLTCIGKKLCKHMTKL